MWNLRSVFLYPTAQQNLQLSLGTFSTAEDPRQSTFVRSAMTLSSFVYFPNLSFSVVELSAINNLLNTHRITSIPELDPKP